MASSRRTYDTDAITLRKVFAKDPGNSNVPALRTLTADGQGGTYWAVPSTLGVYPSFNQIVTSGGTYTADLSYNTFRLTAAENIGMVDGPPGSNQTYVYAKAFSQFDVSGENSVYAFLNNQLDSSVTFAGQGGITLRADPATNTMFIVGPASNAYTVSTGIYGFSQLKVIDAASTITSSIQNWNGNYITATSPSTILNLIGIDDIHLSTNVTTNSVFVTISTFTSKGYLDISAHAYGAYPSTLSTVSSLYVQTTLFDSTIAYLSSSSGFGFSSVVSSIDALAMSTGMEFYILTGLINARATIIQLNSEISNVNTNIQSTSIGLGTLGYISTGGGGAIGSQQLVSTVEGLGSAGYLSTAGGVIGDVTTANLRSTVQGLGTSGYISSLSTIVTSTIFNTGSISTYSLEVFGPATLTNSGSTILRGPVYIAGPTYIAGSFNAGANTIVSPGNMASTVTGLGTSRYISSSQLQSSITGLGSLGYLSALRGFTVSSGNVTTSSLNLLDPYTNALNYLTVSSGSLLVNGAKIEGGGGGGGGGVAQLVAGTGISISPAGGTGVVTVTNTGATTSYVDTAISSFSTALGPVSGGGGSSTYNFSTVSSVYGSTFVTQLLLASTMTTATILPSQSNLWVAVGYGSSATNSIQTSGNGQSWTDSTAGGFSSAGKGIAYNGSLWVAVGNNGSATGSIQTSGDGRNWSNATTGGFSSGGNGVAWNGSYWIAVGNNGASATTSIQYSLDGRNWSAITSGGFSVRGESVAWNGSYWVAVGQGATVLAGIQYSLDGRTWLNAVSGGFTTSGKGIAWNGSLWVAAGDDTTRPASLQTSTDGSNWSNAVTGGFLSAAWKVAWNGRLWVAVGDESSSLKSIQTSLDGSNWSDIVSGGFSAGNDGYGIAWNGSLWIATGIGASAENSLQYSSDGVNWTSATSGGFTSGAVGVAFSSNLAPGYAQQGLTILSQNIPLFLNSTNQIMAQPSSLVVNNTLLIDGFYKRVGINSNTPAYTLDVNGIGHFLTMSSLAIQISSINGVAYNDAGSITSTVSGLGSAGYVSTLSLRSTVAGLGQNYISTSGLLSTVAGLGQNYISTPSLRSTVVGLGSAGFVSTSALVSTTYGLQTSGFLSTPVITSTVAGLGQNYISSLLNVNTLSTLVLNVSSINGALPGTGSGNGSSLTVSTGSLYASSMSFVNMAQTNTNLWVAVGAGSGAASIKYSTDGLNWIDSSTGGFASQGWGVAWNGRIWVAVGEGSGAASIKYSTDGLNWIDSSTGGFASQGYSVAWNGRIWVAVGVGAGAASIKYSTDGLNWTDSATGGFSSQGLSVAWNGRIWIAVGNGGSAAASIKYSRDGLIWIDSTSGGFSTYGGGIAWNGRLWVATGNGGTPAASIKYSSDGLNWTNSSSGGFSPAGFGVAWNGRMWVALGYGSPSAQSIQYSYDGISWTPGTGVNFASSEGNAAWNGRLWVAVGNAGTASIQTSSDGITWTNATSGAFAVNGREVAYSSNVVPAYNQTNFEIESQNIPNFLQSTNTFSFLPSTIIANNTLFVDTTNRVGINTGNPQTDLDVAGIGRFLTLSTLGLNVSSINGQTFGAPINSTVIGLGSAGYISTSALVSTTRGLQTSGFISTSALVSTTYGLQTSGFLSTPVITSTVAGLGQNYISTLGLRSTVGGLGQIYLSTILFPSTVSTSYGISFTTATLSTSRFLASSIGVNCNNPTQVLDVNGTANFLTLSTGSIFVPLYSSFTVLAGSVDIYTSGNGINWNKSFATGTNVYQIGYNRQQLWVQASQGNAATSLKYSRDTRTWSNCSGGFASGATAVAWGGGIWVAGGTDTTTLKYSGDGITWSNGTNTISGYCGGLGFNGYMWVAVGNGTVNMKYSYNGKTWIDITNNPIGSFGNTVAWNGKMWLAGGQTVTTCKYSYDGINWSNCVNAFGTGTYDVAWNGRYWVAAGQSGGANNLKYSADGITWIDSTSGSPTTAANGVSWNGTVWTVGGQGGVGVKYSYDGRIWSDATGTLPTIGNKNIYSSGPSSYDQRNLIMSQDDVPNFTRSTNQFVFTQSTIQMNNTLQVDSQWGYVGINCNVPGAALDVNGVIKASTILVGTYTGFSTMGPAASNIRLALIQGDAYKPTGTTWSITSDQRIKENIVDADLDRCYNDVMSLKLRRFRYISSFIDATQVYDTRVLGFIAQEVSSIVPKAVSRGQGYGFDDLFTINVDQLQMSLFGAVKKTIQDKEVMASTIKGQQITIETLLGSQVSILSTLNGLQGR